MTAILLFRHPDGDGSVQFDGDFIRVTNDEDCTEAVVSIGPDGMRDLARRLAALADVLDGGAQ